MAAIVIEHHAGSLRVATRPMWLLALLVFALGPIYRIYWVWRTNTDLMEFADRQRNPDGRYSIDTSPATSAIWMALALPGWLFLTFGALPWSASFAPARIGGANSSLAEHITFTVIGIAFVVPALLSLLRTRGRMRTARRLAGLTPDTRWTGAPFLVSLLFELVAVPVWLFAAQHSLNDLWSRYPLLLDEDLHGEFAPPSARTAAIAERPALHEARLERIAAELDQPRARPYVAIGFLLLCLGMFIFQVTQYGFFASNESDVRAVGAYASNLDGAWWRFWVANVLHGSVSHLVGNMSLWLLVAIMVERVVGAWRMVLLVVAGAAGTSSGMWISAPHSVALGASGVLFACFGFAVLLDPRARRPIGRFGWALTVIGLTLSTFAPGIASGGHVGGLIAGLTVGLFVRLVWRPADSATPALIGWPAPDAIDRTAPLAPNRELPVEARLQHLIERRNAQQLTDIEYERLRTALLTRG
ncbi:MAG: rhomboid family intramembrane serine protease [Thermoleophilia bacterium]|nr:rhomboid family intramembrane serine protease [Thermoleophilia bacterium]